MFAAGDVNFLELINNGCNGLSSMVGNVYPREVKEAFNNLLENKPVNLNKLNDLINEVTNNQPIVNIKTHYNKIGIKVGNCRSPIISL